MNDNTNRSDDNRPFDDARFGNTPVDGEPTEAVASPDDDAIENIAESLPGAGTLHDGEAERTAGENHDSGDTDSGVTDDGVTDNDDPAIPSRPAPLG
jgi:hypothetical protein